MNYIFGCIEFEFNLAAEKKFQTQYPGSVVPLAMFQSYTIKPPLGISLVMTKEKIVTLRVQRALLLWSAAQHTLFCREFSFVATYEHMEGGSHVHDVVLLFPSSLTLEHLNERKNNNLGLSCIW